MFVVENAGASKNGQALEMWTRGGAYVGIVTEHYGKGCKVYFNSSATRGSKRTFATPADAVDFLYQRRVKKGWAV